jgi:hypothetical protein
VGLQLIMYATHIGCLPSSMMPTLAVETLKYGSLASHKLSSWLAWIIEFIYSIRYYASRCVFKKGASWRLVKESLFVFKIHSAGVRRTVGS